VLPPKNLNDHSQKKYPKILAAATIYIGLVPAEVSSSETVSCCDALLLLLFAEGPKQLAETRPLFVILERLD
jgi:hypothetical protein